MLTNKINFVSSIFDFFWLLFKVFWAVLVKPGKYLVPHAPAETCRGEVTPGRKRAALFLCQGLWDFDDVVDDGGGDQARGLLAKKLIHLHPISDGSRQDCYTY